MKENYAKKMDGIIDRLNTRPRLLLHSCCAPCSSHVLFCLVPHFDISILYYNPNISDKSEYKRRLEEMYGLITKMGMCGSVQVVKGKYFPEEFNKIAENLEDEPEGGKRCRRCYELRLRETARLAAEGGYQYFTTTLSVSPHKNATALNEIGDMAGEEYAVSHLPADFKKKDGYKHSVELSRKYNLYRQDYCGCIYSKREK